MKLISLNTWGGRAGKNELLDFFRKHGDVDIFCLQEIWHNGPTDQKEQWGDVVPALLTEIRSVLPEHASFFRPHWQDWYGLTMLISKKMEIEEEGDLFVFRDRKDAFSTDLKSHARNLQYAHIETPAGPRTVINFHGLWNGGGKTDTDERLLQSDNIARFLKEVKDPHVLCGDFNLLPETESLKKLERLGMRNLIKEFGITSTRSRHYTRTTAQFADYTLVSDGIKVSDFKVLPDEVSDHLALYLDFE